ncbi:MAG: SPFH domain-containing protein, partial [Candidatus Nealsonbacteria bacterium]
MTWIILWFIGLIVLLTVSGLLVYFVLAPENLWWTFKKEGSAKIVTRGDQFDKILIQWEGHTLNRVTNDVVEGEEPSGLFGGLFYYGFWPFKNIYNYDFTWTGVKENGEIDHHPKERLDYISLKDDVYWAKVVNAEDKDLLPLTLELLFTVRVFNPYKALFNVQNWLETVINRSVTRVRNIITSKVYNEWIKNTETISKTLIDLLEKEGVLAEFKERYGVEIRAVEVKSINPPEEHRNATLRKFTAERDMEKTITDAEAESKASSHKAEQRAEQIMGSLMQMISKGIGIPREDIAKEFEKDPAKFIEKHKELWERSWKAVYRDQAIARDAFFEFDAPEGTSAEGLIALWQ